MGYEVKGGEQYETFYATANRPLPGRLLYDALSMA